ncbi:trypsin-3-like [Centruroides sculpturatus]|uniref:trypsin-3-like n=1 Tax=Centruroides sculpturatus TaxID=218467 RepID=UPI000C6D1153|nr:trypsin-3-like [Centruroides sculpturatus]
MKGHLQHKYKITQTAIDIKRNMDIYLKEFLVFVTIFCWNANTQENTNNPGIVRRMIGGKEVEIEDYPYMVAMFVKEDPKDVFDYFVGSFTLITTRTALGVAHIVKDYTTEQLLGTVGHKDKYVGTTVRFSEKIVHPDFRKQLFFYDIALLILNSTAILPSIVKPIALPSVNRKYTSGTALMVGWGRIGKDSSRFLKMASVNIVNVNDTVYKGQSIYMTEYVILTRQNGASIMPGDSGGPLIYENNDGVRIEIGVSSTSQMKPGGVNIYVSTSYFIDFIKQNCVGDLTFA